VPEQQRISAALQRADDLLTFQLAWRIE